MRLPLNLAFSISFLFSFSTSHRLQPFHSLNSSPQTLASDILSLLSSPQCSSTVPPSRAAEIFSCLRFIVPKTPTKLPTHLRLHGASDDVMEEDNANAMIWWPPPSVEELARLAFDSGGDPEVIHLALDPTRLTVPDVDNSRENKCELTRTPYAYRFVNEELNSYFAFLFELIVARGPSVGLNVSLSRFDFFHGHLFIAENSRRLGILFHAKEYPACQKGVFPYNLGYCQRGSNMIYDDSMNLRNILWLAPLPSNVSKAYEAPGILVVLDAHPEGIIYKELIPDYVQLVRTVYEEYFGEHVVDINYFNIGNVGSSDGLFIC